MSMTRRAGFAVLACGVTAAVALAESKTERQHHEEDLIKEANDALDSACGCPAGIKYDVDWSSYTRAQDMEHISHAARTVAENKVRVCTDELKAKWCKWSKTVVFKIHASKTKHFVFNVSKDGKTYDCGTAPYEAAEATCDGEAVIDAFKNAN
jgi:hypothetical protein